MKYITKIRMGAIIIIVVAIAILAFIIFGGFQQAIFGNSFVKPDWARLECNPTDSFEGSYLRPIYLDEQNSFTCEGFTQECRVKINIQTGTFRCNSIDLFVNGIEKSFTYDEYFIVNQGDVITFDDGFCLGGADFPYTTIDMNWRPWRLERIAGGAKFVVNSANCDISSSEKARIRREDYTGDELVMIGGEGQKWLNYVNDWVYGPATNIFEYQGKEVYCNAGQIFEIVELQMADGSLRKLDPTYQDTLENGEIINGLGNKIKNVECCPNERNCNNNFEYEQIISECFTDIQCLNAGGPIPISGTQYVTEKCQNNICVEQDPITVDCTNNGFCANGEICDLSTTNYGKCITQITTGYCGDGKCESLLGENSITCLTDCKAKPECSWYQQAYIRTEKDYGFLWWRAYTPFVDPIVTEEDACRTSDLVLLGIVVVIIIALGTIAMALFRPEIKRLTRRRRR